MLGFVLALGQLASEWLFARPFGSYLGVVCGLPRRLRTFFCGFAAFAALPRPRDSFNPIDDVFINNRGIYLPRPAVAPEFIWVAAAFALGLLGAIWLRLAARDQRERTGEHSDTRLATFALLVLPAWVASAVTG